MADIPLRPKEFDSKSIRKADADCLTYAAIFGCKNEDAFARFHPEYLDGAGRLNESGRKACRQFFIYAKNKQYLDDYRATLDEFCKRKGGARTEVVSIDDSRKDRALKSLLNQAMSMVEGGADLDADTLKTITEIFKKLNILKDDVEQEIRPLRFLPTTCGECRYKAFVESSVLDGSAIDCCAYCKARKVAEENGYRFNDGKDLLEIPENVIKGLESRNDVKLEDIISGASKINQTI